MNEREALKLALEALERGETELRWKAITAIKEALAQPEQDSVAMADYMALVEKYAFLKAAQPAVTEEHKHKPLTEQFIMDSTRDLSLDVRWPSTFIDVWRLCEAAHGIKE